QPDALNASVANAFQMEIRSHPDISTNSWGGHADCTANANNPVQKAEEDAFDDGVFVVQAAGNYGPNGSNSTVFPVCAVGNPANTPKVFAANGMPVQNCDYATNCVPTVSHATKGGGTTRTPDLVDHVGAFSMIGLTVP